MEGDGGFGHGGAVKVGNVGRGSIGRGGCGGRQGNSWGSKDSTFNSSSFINNYVLLTIIIKTKNYI